MQKKYEEIYDDKHFYWPLSMKEVFNNDEVTEIMLNISAFITDYKLPGNWM